MKATIENERDVLLCDLPEDEWLVVYQGKLCIREASGKDQGLFTIYGEMLPETNRKTPVQRIKEISVKLL